MKNGKTKTVVSFVLFFVFVFSMFPVTAFAERNNVVYDGTTFGTNGYYNVISKKDYTLVPGAATETEMVLNNAAGNRRQVLHIVEADPSNPDISIIPGYYGLDKDLSDVNNQQAAKLTDMTAYYEDVLGYNVVAGMNTDLYYAANAPRILVYNGTNLGSGRTTTSYFGVYKDENDQIYCEVKPYVAATFQAELASGNLIHAVSVSFGMVVNNGALTKPTEERTSSAAARSLIGVKEDGTLVLVMNDGRGANNSVGFNDYELGESMLSLGCKWAANCDGGGSSTFVSKRVGEDAFTMRSVPCDGAERPTIHGIFIVSNVAPTGVLGSIAIESGNDYFAPGSSYTFGASAIDTHGYAMDTPANVTWALDDASFGAISNGMFVSNGTQGDVTVQALVNDAVVGERTIHIVNPTDFHLTATAATLPYSTPETVRSITLPIAAKYGESDVFIDENSVSVELADPNSGTLNGFVFYATDNTTVACATITVTYSPTNTALEYTVTYGQGSEVLWDFEDGDISAWVGTDEAEQYLRDHNVPLKSYGTFDTPFITMANGGQISWSNKTTTALSSKSKGGQAHGGDKALAVTFHMKGTEFNSWVYSIIWNIQGNTVLRDVENGKAATSFGCWIYVPKGFYTAKNNGAQAFQLQALKGASSTATLSGLQLNMQYNGKNLNALTESDIPENRWIYVSADLTANNFVKLCDPLVDTYRSPSVFRMYVKPSEAQNMTYYLDDFTLDYSSAVDDRNPPVISDPTYCTADTNIALDGQTLTTNVVSFNATVADFVAANAEGLDYTTAAVYVDGVKQTTTASGSMMSAENVVFTNGHHRIRFEIADKLGNYTTLTKSLVINAADATSAITLSGHNDLDNTPECGSIYYADLVAESIEDIDSVSASLYLQTANTWELDHMIVADGFTADYTANEVDPNRVTVTVSKTGETALTGAQTLVSLPIRVWTFDESTWVGGDGTGPVHMTAAQRYASNYGEPVLLIETTVEKGVVNYTDGGSGTFGGSTVVDTKVTGNKTNPWHAHDEELTIRHQEATCLSDGFKDRSYCESCGSVVDWGATVSASKHAFTFTDGVLKCATCGDLFNGVYEDGKNYVDGIVIADGWIGDAYYLDGVLLTGVVIIDNVAYDLGNGTTKELYTGFYLDDIGYRYYSIGMLLKGFATLQDGTHYFDDHTGYAPVDSFVLGGRTYKVEGDKGKVLGAWGYTEQGKRYYYSLRYYQNRWIEVDGDTYYVNNSGYAVTGRCVLSKLGEYIGAYEFDEDGKLIGPITGVVASPDGQYLYYAENGILAKNKLIKDGDDYYYARNNYYLITWSKYLSSEDIDGYDLSIGEYTFGADGKMQFLQGPQPDQFNENYLTFYQKGQRIYNEGLYEYNGDYYYVRSNGLLLTWSKNLTEAQTNGLVPAGEYSFGADGKLLMVNGPQPDRYNENYLTFYQNGQRVYDEGLYEYNGDYYYVRSNGLLLTWSKNLTEAQTNGLVPPGEYSFGADGKLLMVNGPQPDSYNSSYLTFYQNGLRVYEEGLYEHEGAYYYVRSNGLLQTWGKNLTQEKTNGLVPAGYYDFGADGKMIVK